MYARFEVRRLDLAAARKVLGTAIGMCPKEALFKGYIHLEFDVRSRCPLLYRSPLTIVFLPSSENLIAFEHSTRSTSRHATNFRFVLVFRVY
jgi:hypothetical protein